MPHEQLIPLLKLWLDYAENGEPGDIVVTPQEQELTWLVQIVPRKE